MATAEVLLQTPPICASGAAQAAHTLCCAAGTRCTTTTRRCRLCEQVAAVACSCELRRRLRLPSAVPPPGCHRCCPFAVRGAVLACSRVVFLHGMCAMWGAGLDCEVCAAHARLGLEFESGRGVPRAACGRNCVCHCCCCVPVAHSSAKQQAAKHGVRIQGPEWERGRISVGNCGGKRLRNGLIIAVRLTLAGLELADLIAAGSAICRSLKGAHGLTRHHLAQAMRVLRSWRQ